MIYCLTLHIIKLSFSLRFHPNRLFSRWRHFSLPTTRSLEKEVAFELIKKNELLDRLFVTLKFSVYSTYVMLAINSVFIELTTETLNPFS